MYIATIAVILLNHLDFGLGLGLSCASLWLVYLISTENIFEWKVILDYFQDLLMSEQNKVFFKELNTPLHFTVWK